jgi:hypothetical protein
MPDNSPPLITLVRMTNRRNAFTFLKAQTKMIGVFVGGLLPFRADHSGVMMSGRQSSDPWWPSVRGPQRAVSLLQFMKITIGVPR